MDDIKPVDQVAAGGTAQPQDQGGMLDALRSRGPVPQQALANIMQPQPGPNMGSAIGSGALAGLAGQAGQNPYLAQQAQGAKDAFYQQLNAQREQRAQKAQQDRQYERQNDMAFKVSEELARSSDPAAKAAGWQNIKRLSGPLGVKIPDDVIQSLSRGQLDAKTLEAAVLERQA